MASDGWQPVGNTNTPTWKPEKENDSVQGLFVDVKDNVGPNGSKLYTLQKDDGSFVGVWGSAVIDDRMTSIPLGDQVKIVYLGTTKSKTPGRTVKQYDIFRKPVGQPTDETAETGDSVETEETEDIPF